MAFHELTGKRDRGVGTGIPGDGGRDNISFGIDVIAEASTAFCRSTDTIAQVATCYEFARGVGGEAPCAISVEARVSDFVEIRCCPYLIYLFRCPEPAYRLNFVQPF